MSLLKSPIRNISLFSDFNIVKIISSSFINSELSVFGGLYAMVTETISIVILLKTELNWLETTQPSSGGAVTANSSCCANCVEPPRPPSNGDPIYRFFGMPAMRTRWMAGTVAHKNG